MKRKQIYLLLFVLALVLYTSGCFTNNSAQAKTEKVNFYILYTFPINESNYYANISILLDENVIIQLENHTFAAGISPSIYVGDIIEIERGKHRLYINERNRDLEKTQVINIEERTYLTINVLENDILIEQSNIEPGFQ